MSLRVSALLLALGGCGIALAPHGELESDTGVSSAVWIDGLDPAGGPLTGGTVVALTGEGFEGTYEVWFDDTPVDAFRQDAQTLILTAPPWAEAASVAVTVTSDLGTATQEAAFTYGAGEGGPSGEIEGLVEYSFLQVACPSCFGAGSQLSVQASAAFHDPVAGSWIAWLPPVGSCALNPASAPPTASTRDVGSWVYLESGARSLGLHRSTGETGPIYAADGLSDADYLRNAQWDVRAPEAGLFVAGGLLTTQGFDAIEPFEMLFVEPDAAFAAPISRSGATFAWAPSGVADRFVLWIDAYDDPSGAFLGTALCVGPDSGALTVPGSLLSAFPAYSLLGIGVYRYQVQRTPTDTGAALESVSWFGVLGTGHLVP